MDNGFLEVNNSFNEDNENKSNEIEGKSRKKTIIITIIVIVLCLLMAGGVTGVIVVDDKKQKEFEAYFGGYATAQEYVDTLISLNSFYLLRNTSYDNYYGFGIDMSERGIKTIKYVKIKFRGYNTLGKYVESDFDDKTFRFAFGSKHNVHGDYERVYNSEDPLYKIKIHALTIEYEDDTYVKFNTGMLACLKEGNVLY